MNRRVLIPAALVPDRPPQGSQIWDFAGDTMGTRWQVKLAAVERPTDLAAALEAELDIIVAEMSHWEPDSLLSRFNRAPAGTRFSIPPRFAQVLDAGLRLAHATAGAYDPAAGQLIADWGFGAGEKYASPDFQLPTVGKADNSYASLQWDPLRAELRQPGGVMLDFSSIAKGYAVDRLAELLTARGHQHHLVDIGGELRGAGMKPDGQPWWVSLEQPEPGAIAEEVLALHGLSVATSGDYRRFIVKDGERLSHTLDPRQGRPVPHAAATVTVAHTSCMQADALSTALTVLGPHDGMAFAAAQCVAARFILRTADGWTVHATPAWEALAA